MTQINNHSPLPTWEEIEEKCSSGEPLNPLERFIYEFEPVGDDDLFRKSLQNVLSQLNERVKELEDGLNNLMESCTWNNDSMLLTIEVNAVEQARALLTPKNNGE